MEEAIQKPTPDTIGATGRRKEAVCRVNMKPGSGSIMINGLTKERYLCRKTLVESIMRPLYSVEMAGKFDIVVAVKGGGISGQAGAIKLAIARALTYFNPEFRAALKKEGLLTVDSRQVERKKYGRPKARKRFQFSKR